MLASNAPFDEKGFAQVIRDLERHELLLSGSRQGDMGTSTGNNIGPLPVDQTTEPDGVGGSPVATLADLAASAASTRAAIPTVSYPIALNKGGTGATDAATARSNIGISGLTVTPGDATHTTFIEVPGTGGYPGLVDPPYVSIRLNGTLTWLTFRHICGTGDRVTELETLSATNGVYAPAVLASGVYVDQVYTRYATTIAFNAVVDVSYGVKPGFGLSGISSTMTFQDNLGVNRSITFVNGICTSFV